MAEQVKDKSHCPPVEEKNVSALNTICLISEKCGQTKKENTPSFFGLRSPVGKLLVSFSGQFLTMCLLLVTAMTDEPELCYHRQNATGLQLYHSSEPVVLATQLDISGKKKKDTGQQTKFLFRHISTRDKQL